MEYFHVSHLDVARACLRAYTESDVGVRDGWVDAEATVREVADGLVVVAVRGTERGEIRDWRADVRFLPAWGALGFGLIHRGAWRCAAKLYPAVDELLQYCDPYARVVFAGHSLGGMTSLCMGLMHDCVDEVVTFGTPACMRLRGDYPHSVTRYERLEDPVPRIPSWYRPVGDLQWWSGAELLSFSAAGALRPSDALNIADHDMRGYVAALEQSEAA